MVSVIDGNILEFEPTAHGTGLKKVFIKSSDSPTMLTHFAYGKLFPGDEIAEHSHNSMEEIFYFLQGEGVYTVGQSPIPVFTSIVVRIPAGVVHSLKANGLSPLEFLYFGIATV